MYFFYLWVHFTCDVLSYVTENTNFILIFMLKCYQLNMKTLPKEIIFIDLFKNFYEKTPRSWPPEIGLFQVISGTVC